MVSGGPSGLVVLSAMVRTVILLERLVNLGRSGTWGTRLFADAYYCRLSFPPSMTNSNYGARVVNGDVDGRLVYLTVIYAFLPLEYFLPLGRI